MTPLPLTRRRAALAAAGALAGACAIAALTWVVLAFVAAPWPQRRTTVVIPEGSSVSAIARQLHDEGVLAHGTVFRLLVRARGAGRLLHAGEYVFAPHQSANAVLDRLVAGGAAPYARVTIPEGFTAVQIARRMADAGLGDAQTYERIFLHTPLLIDGQRTVNMEGFLFPDTYDFDRKATPMENARRMVAEFESKLPPDAVERARKLGMTIPQVVTIASLVEREAKVDGERPLMAGIYYHRLRIGMPLEVDATIEYALPSHRAVITGRDLALDSPYNTYRRMGLPPTPIANPGLASLRAAFEPEASPYLYYVYRGGGRHAFAKTYAEQQANIARYLK
ncbi:MAG TPA: endolytic transglycosylase MltG [Candidatus Dormibacteraeota bacterium]|nr:endolytic transglycosylase MltG [Candidatus Dormibacteraeota bacterium]